ncbi:AraC family transcriptional regulator [Xanthomonas hortorum pv. taraxaci]|nr:AraC family transcriptional regulator [Xanthomonas hortorum pv. taraxaci]
MSRPSPRYVFMAVAAFDQQLIRFEPSADARAAWSEVMLERHGLYCAFDASKSLHSTAQNWSLGNVVLTLADLSAMALATACEKQASWQGEWLYLKLMTGGEVDIEMAGMQHRFAAGSMFMLDPSGAFSESFALRSQMTALRIPKAGLRDRGLRHSLNGLLVPDMDSADMRATRDLIHCIAAQHVSPSTHMRHLMEQQLLNLVDAILATPTGTVKQRSSEAVLFRAKRHIHQHLGDQQLDSAAVAAAAHVSVKHLQRLFRAEDNGVMRHVWQVRLQHAHRLLSQGDGQAASVQEIAWRCGFATAAHFSRAFRACYAMSPSNAQVPRLR